MMAAVGYLWLMGLPLARSLATPPARAPADAAVPQVILRGGLIYDLNPAAYAAGVMLSTPLRQASQICADIFSSTFVEAEYANRLRPLIRVLRGHTHLFEFDGPNRLFIDFSGSGQPDRVLADLAATCPGVLVFAGVGSSKFAARAAVLAALARSTAVKHPMFLPKPDLTLGNGQVAPVAAAGQGDGGAATAHRALLSITDLLAGGGAGEGERSFIADLPVGYLWPLGEETREKLYRLGFKTCGDVAACDAQELGRVLGTEGLRAANLARGVDRQPVRASYTPDEVVRRVDFEAPMSSKITLKRSLTMLGFDLGRALSDEALGGRDLELIMYLDGGCPQSARRSFSRPRCGQEAIVAALTGLFDGISFAGAVTGMEVLARGLTTSLNQQLSFLDRAVGDDRQGTLLATLSALERKFPGGAVRLGTPPVSRRERMLHLVDPLRNPRDGVLLREPAD